MSIAILALMAWLVMIVFSLVPKGLTLTEMVLLYFVIVVLTITIFTILDVNLNWVPLTRKVEGSFAMYICRFFVIPLLVLMAACVLLSNMKVKWRVVLSAIIVMVLSGADRIYLRLDLMEFVRWNVGYSVLMYGVFVILIWRIAHWYIGLDKEVSKES
ncbi:hypothetical protein ACFPES_31560 [Paenibacillus sp. GCM10023248]|uniref:hypothetical protein n=1 Tax=unclassified Paenibacillus TaxID=185978 RepID=UPI0023786D94|nr:hypothetical protein [Paenibacillus sp. MAHUQ-63]MDD9271579.1 hypothetical protein [Paenibacillus sp. MAHUQ-63]